MSLATRCPACGTVFRVVQDQLRVSEGWVRCGHCQEVFNALESLFELGAEAPLPAAGNHDAPAPPRPAASPPPPPAASPPAAPEVDLSDPGDASPESRAAPPPAWPPQPPAAAFEAPISVSGLLARSDVDTDPAPMVAPPVSEPEPESEPEPGAWDGEPVQPALIETEPAPAPAAEPEANDPAATLPFEPDDEATTSQVHDEAIEVPASRLFEEEAEDARPAAAPSAVGDEAAPSQLVPPQREWQRKRPRRPRTPDTEAASSSFSRGQPGFLRQAERDAVWQRPGVRTALLATAVVGAALLVLQTLLLFRDGLAARWPSTQPWLTRLCGLADCQVRAPRALDRISLDGSKLTSGDAPDGAGAVAGSGKVLRFVAELHNAAPYRVLAPALEISFTDPLGQVVARRVLLPEELGLASGSIAPRSPWQVDARLDVGGLSITGFSVEIFYP